MTRSFQAAREKQVAIKELLSKLSDEIKTRQAEAKDALKELKWVGARRCRGLAGGYEGRERTCGNATSCLRRARTIYSAMRRS